MNLNSELLRGVYEYGLESPSSVQQRAILPMIKGECRDDSDDGLQLEHTAKKIIEGDDVIVEAPSATGKTLSLCVSALQNIDPGIKTCQVLMLTPSADMARRLQKTAVDIGQFVQIDCTASVGGSDIEDDINILHDSQQFVVGTPGRILTLIRRRAITVDSLKLFALDEADEIFARGFTDDVLAIHRLVPEFAQVVFLTATMLGDVLETATSLVRTPLHIVIKGTKLSFRGVKQFCVAVETEDSRLDILSQLSTTLEDTQAVIFCNLRKKVEWLSTELTSRGISNTAMHGDMPAFERARIVGDFRTRSSRILLATNMLARGLDVQQMSLVVNYELPTRTEDYIYRTNSSGRVERQFITVNLMSTDEAYRKHDIEHHYSTQVEELSISKAKIILDFTENTC